MIQLRSVDYTSNANNPRGERHFIMCVIRFVSLRQAQGDKSVK
jgi:hypothetical protein